MLDSPAFAGRLRTTNSRRSTYERRAVMSRPRIISDMRPARSIPQPTSASPKPALGRATPKATPPRQSRSRVLKRGLVLAKARPAKHRRSANPRGIALSALAIVLFVFGSGVGIMQLTTNQKAKAQVRVLAAHAEGTDAGGQDSGDVPSETRPSSPASYRVAPGLPRVITIAKLGVEARVLRTGVSASNEIKTPNNIHDVGWYEGSARPGENGAVFIDGHVHGPTLPGAFVDLKKLKSGDKITIERGDGKIFTYHVVKSQSYDKNNVDMGAAFSSAVPGKPGLNLMTCDGKYDKSGEYQRRLVVFAVQD